MIQIKLPDAKYFTFSNIWLYLDSECEVVNEQKLKGILLFI